MHWAVAVPFMVCYATAVVLIAVYNLHPERPLRAVVSWTHRLSAICLFVLPTSIAVRHWYDVAIHLENVREVWRWTVDDLKWLCLMGPSTFSKKVILPEQGKFNAAEKINFMMLTVTVPLYLVTGTMIWTHQFAFLAWVVHLALAANATPLMLGHVFMATVNPDTRVGLSGMFSGYVSRHWASHHYGRWYKEHFGEADPALAHGMAAAPVAAGLPNTDVTPDIGGLTVEVVPRLNAVAPRPDGAGHVDVARGEPGDARRFVDAAPRVPGADETRVTTGPREVDHPSPDGLHGGPTHTRQELAPVVPAETRPEVQAGLVEADESVADPLTDDHGDLDDTAEELLALFDGLEALEAGNGAAPTLARRVASESYGAQASALVD